MDNKTKILIAFPVALVIILIIAANQVPFVKDLSDVEKQVLEFIPVDLKIEEEKMAAVSGKLKSPVEFIHAKTVRRPVSKNKPAPQRDHYERNVSLIVISGGKKMAIIEGRLVKEGDRVDGTRVAAIEPGRVLLENETSQWLYLKK